MAWRCNAIESSMRNSLSSRDSVARAADAAGSGMVQRYAAVRCAEPPDGKTPRNVRFRSVIFSAAAAPVSAFECVAQAHSPPMVGVVDRSRNGGGARSGKGAPISHQLRGGQGRSAIAHVECQAAQTEAVLVRRDRETCLET